MTPGAEATVASQPKRSNACPGAELTPTATNSTAIEAATLCLIGRIRAAWHLGPVRANSALSDVAASQVRDMVRRDYFADRRPSGQTPLSLVARTGYRAKAANMLVAQNIAWGTGSDATPARIVAAWMASAPHRKVILTRAFRDAGVGALPAVPRRFGKRSYGATYAIELGARR